MTPNDAQADGSGTQRGESPGRLLASAREARSISAAELAARLRLDTKIIQALERDDFENLPAPLFVKGYIRSISKELGCECAVILEAYGAQAPSDPPSLADFVSRAPVQVGIDTTVVKAVTYGLVAILILLMILWWRSNYDSDGLGNGDMSAAEVEFAETADPLPYSYAVVEHGNNDWRLQPLPASPSGDPVTADPSHSSLPLSIHGENPLSLTTTSEAWVEIYDEQGSRLYYGLAQTGKPVELNGYGYYRLILGNAGSVTLRHNTKLIDLNAFSIEGVAQLELGSKSNSDDGNR